MNVSMRIYILLCLPFLVIPAPLPADGAPGGEYHVLFDRSHAEHRDGEPWSIDDDEPLPAPDHPRDALAWKGPLSRLAIRLYRTGRYRLETVPPGGAVTWLDGDNEQDLSLFDLLVVCEPHVPFTAAEAGAIRSFVASGRSLLLVGRGGGDGDAVVGALNGLLAGLLDDGTGGEIRLRRAGRPVAREYEPRPGAPVDPVLAGPFGTVRRLPEGRALEMTWRDLGRDVRPGPAGAGGAPLYLIVRRGDGTIGIAPDADLLAADTAPGVTGDGTTFFLNLIALLVDDRYPAAPEGEMSLRSGPEAGLVTEHGVTISFRADRPCWGFVEIETEGSPFVVFRSLHSEQTVRVRGLGPDREYRASLRLYDGWGHGPLRPPPIAFRTAPGSTVEFGDIRISEVFWGGENQYIELYNTLDRPVDLAGWSIMDNEARWFLDGTVDAGAFHLLSRFDRGGEEAEVYGRTPEPVLLDREGDFLILQDDDANVISTANLAGGSWPAGGEGASMERVDLAGPDEPGNWDTALIRESEFQGTPGAPNSRKRLEVSTPALDGAVLPGGIRLSWDRVPGDSTAWVSLYRSEVDEEGMSPTEYVRLNGEPIPAEQGSYLDVGPEPGVAYQYILGVSSAGGAERFSDPVRIRSTSADLPMPLNVTMGQNYPNPFNPRTEIRYSLEKSEGGGVEFPLRATLSIFSMRGRQVRNLEERDIGPGEHVVQWDGRDDNGEPVSSGSYYYRLTITRPETREVLLQLSKKMVLMR